MEFVTVRLRRVETHYVQDERTPILLQLSRVPCVGELVSITHATEGGKDTALGGNYKVVSVLHMCHPNVHAWLNIVEITEE
jgi:hypothetical protein